MKEASSKMIWVLFVLSLILIVVSVSVVEEKFGLSKSYNLLTGAGTGVASGLSNLSIQSSTAISNQYATINFGTGYVDSAYTECVMDSDNHSNQTGPSCVGFNNLSRGFLLENTGNENISVNWSCNGNCTAKKFINGTNPAFEIKVTNALVANQSGEIGSNDRLPSCYSYDSVIFGGWNLTYDQSDTTSNSYLNETVYKPINSSGAWICGNLTYFPLSPINTHDAAVVDINVSVPQDAQPGTGEKKAFFTFFAVSSG